MPINNYKRVLLKYYSKKFCSYFPKINVSSSDHCVHGHLLVHVDDLAHFLIYRLDCSRRHVFVYWQVCQYLGW